MPIFLRWWLIFCISVFSIGMLYYFGFIDELYEKDQTKLSFVIIAMYFITSAVIGFYSYKLEKTQKKPDKALSLGAYMYELMPIMGLIGTVIGFIFMFGDSFLALELTDPETVKTALKSIAIGISTALYTTLTGMVCSEILKLQIVNIEKTSNGA